MEQEEKRFLKWVVILIATIVLAVVTAILVFVYCPVSTVDGITANEVQPLPEQITFTAEQLNASARNGGTTSVTVRANVEPYNAENTKVDFTVAWKDAPSSYTKNVAEYVTVRQDSDGSQTATITCIKAFTEYNAVITVTTRDGGFTAQCLCTFSGKATSLELSVEGKELRSDDARGTYYLLDSNKATTVNIHATNVYDTVLNPRYSLSVNVPSVMLWRGDCSYGEYGETYFSKVWEENLQTRYNAGKLFSVGSVSNGKFTITTKKSMEYGAESTETVTDEYGLITRYGKDACVYDPYDMGTGSTNGVVDIHGKNDSNVEKIDKDEKKGFTLKILPNTEKDFEYTVAGSKYKYSGLKDITAAFDVKLAEDSFEINIPENFGIKDVVKYIHGGQEVTLEGATDISYPFKLEVPCFANVRLFVLFRDNSFRTSCIRAQSSLFRLIPSFRRFCPLRRSPFRRYNLLYAAVCIWGALRGLLLYRVSSCD